MTKQKFANNDRAYGREMAQLFKSAFEMCERVEESDDDVECFAEWFSTYKKPKTDLNIAQHELVNAVIKIQKALIDLDENNFCQKTSANKVSFQLVGPARLERNHNT